MNTPTRIPVSLCLIVKNVSAHIKTALDSAQEFVDEICITDTGSTDNSLEVIQALPYAAKIKISHFNPTTNPEGFFEDGAIADFAAARNYNFSQASHQWVLWMDSDDVFQGLQTLQPLLGHFETNKVEGAFFNYWYIFRNGRAEESHIKLQLVKMSPHFKWRGRIHEDLLSDHPVQLAQNDQIVRIHLNGDTDDQTKWARNLRILLKDLAEQGDKPDPRTLFYTSRAFVTGRQFKEAIPLLEKYLELSGWAEETYEAMYLLADCYLEIKEYEAARSVAMSAMKLKPNFPDAYFTMARSYALEGEHQKVIEWCNLGFKLPPAKEAVTHFPHRYNSQPLATMSISYLYLGKLDEALDLINKAVQCAPNDKHMLGIKQMVEFVKRRKDVSVAYANIASYLKDKKEEWKIRTLLGTVSGDLDASPIISKLRYDFMPPTQWADKTVAILAFGSVEAWSPKNEKQGGIGGSEEAVLNLSRELQQLGYKVTVYTNTGTEDGVYDGVVWKMFTEFNGKDDFDTVIIWRATGMLDYELKSNATLFDMHDVPQPGDWEGDRPSKVGRIMVKSQYHRNLLPEVSDDKFAIVGNGINPGHFRKSEKREYARCIYSSAIDRGLDLLLDLWPRIRAEVPEATLHIYYGFQTFKLLNKDNPERMRYVNKIEKKMADLAPLGVFYHGRVDHETLATEMKKSDVWLYPTYFPEISCITAMKAQAAGAIPICTDYAALDETVQFGRKMSGDIYLPDIQDKFIENAIGMIKTDPFIKENLRKSMMRWAIETFAWKSVAKKWVEVIEQIKHAKS